MFIITPRDVERRESGSMFCDTKTETWSVEFKTEVSNDDWKKKGWNFFLGLRVRENPDRTRLTLSSCADPLQSASLCWLPLFSLFSEATLYFLLALLFARNSPFYLCPLLFSFVFLSPYSAYFGVLCNFLARFSGLALRRLLVAFFGRSVSLYPAYFQLKPSLHELELWQFPPVDKA